MSSDKRFYFIRNIEGLKTEVAESQVTEYELITDAHIVGNFNHGPYNLKIWEISPKNVGEKRKLLLRIQEKFPLINRQIKNDEYSGYYHGGHIAEEIVFFTSLFLRRRIKLGPELRFNDIPHYFSFKAKNLDKQLIEGKSTFEDLKNWFRLVEGLKIKYHQRFILSARLYHRAISSIDEQPDMAYLDLISAIETLCQFHKMEDFTITDLNNEKLTELIEVVSPLDLRNKIEKEIVKSNRFIKRRFLAFILDNIDNEFWTFENRPKIGRIEKDELLKFLERVYDQRSKTLHNGEPFPGYIFFPPPIGEEIPSSLGITMGEKHWSPKEFIPYPHFFERLVNHVLKTFLKKHQIETAEHDFIDY